MVNFPKGDVNLGFSLMIPWLSELWHAPSASFRHLSKIIPPLEAKVVHILPRLPADPDDEEEDEDGDKNDDDNNPDKMDVTETPTRPAPSSTQDSEVTWILTNPGVRMLYFPLSRDTLITSTVRPL